MSDTVEMLELFDCELRATLIFMLRSLADKRDSMKNNWTMKAKRNPKSEPNEMLQIEKPVTNGDHSTLNGLVSRLYTAGKESLKWRLLIESFVVKKKKKRKKPS